MSNAGAVRTHRTARSSVERFAAAGEAPIRRFTGSGRANPLPHAGTISVFLLGVVTLTGIYITLFFEFGFVASYEAVEAMHDHPIQQVVRSLHRYSSAALVVTTMVHAWRIFVAGRFTRARRWRWLSGLSALILVWLAGVTGYWLVWDDRAQALAEAVERLVGDTGWGAGFVVDRLVGSGAGSGSGVMLLVWFLHLLLTAVIGFFVWRHLRRTRLGWMPPRPWMAAMGLGLLLVALLIPADLRPPADPASLVPDMPLDPFVLFLLPPMLTGWAGTTVTVALVVAAVAAAVPWVLRDRSETVVVIDAAKCTGCELCVADCPYLALTMVAPPVSAAVVHTADNADERHRALAIVDPAACVGCGICLGSCSFGAMALPGAPSGLAGPVALDVAGRRVVIACRRHVRSSGRLDSSVAVIEVQCTGMFHARAVGDLVARGAASVQIVGCGPGECVYGIGNSLTHERLTGERAPHVSRATAGLAVEDYVAAGDLERAVADPGRHIATDVADLPDGRRSRVAAAVLVAVSLAAIGLATLLPFGGEAAAAAVRVIVDHDPGNRLVGQVERSGAPGDTTTVVVSIDDVEVRRVGLPTSGGVSVGVVDVEVEPGEAVLDVTLLEGDGATVLYEGPADFGEGRRFLIEARDVPPPPGIAEGRRVFEEPRLGGCGVCHSLEAGDDGVGPSLAGVGTRAAGTVPGLDADAYLLESVVDPDAHVVDGYRSGQMLPIYSDRLTGTQIEALVLFLASLTEEGS